MRVFQDTSDDRLSDRVTEKQLMIAGYIENPERTDSVPPSRNVYKPVCPNCPKEQNFPVERFVVAMGDDRIPDDVPNIVLRSRASRKHTANPLANRPNDPLPSLAPTKCLQHASMPGGKSEVSCRRRIKLHQCFYTLPLPLQLTRYFQSNNASLASPSQKIGSGRLHRTNFSGEMGCDILNGREQRLFRNKPFLLKREDIHLKKGLVAAKRAAEISETVVGTSGKQRGLRSAFQPAEQKTI